MLVIFGRNQLVLAAREKLHEIIQELPGLGQTAVLIQLQPREIPPQQDPMVHGIQHHAVWIGIFQQRFAEGVKRCERHCFAALAGGLHHPRFHFARCFLRERQRQDVFAAKLRIRMQQVSDPLGDDPRLSRSRPRDDQQRPFAVGDRAPLRIIQSQPALLERLHFEQCFHESRRVAEFRVNRKRQKCYEDCC